MMRNAIIMKKTLNKFGFNYSYSSVSTFNQCPMRFKLQYLDKKPTLKTEALIKGNAVHNMVEELINDISINKAITIELNNYKYKQELIHFLELETLRSGKYTTKDNYFINTCEEKIIDNDLITVGKLDRVYHIWTDKGKVLLDYKTGKVRPKDYYYPQLALYTYMYNKKYPKSPIKYWEIDWLTESKKYFLEPINQEIINTEVTKYKSSIATIEKTIDFTPKLSPLCMWCGVLYACPMKKQALNRFKGIADRKGLDVLQIIKKSIENKSKIKKIILHSKIAGTSFCDINKLNIKKGDKLILRREPNNEFDKNAIRIMWGVEKIGYIKKYLAKDMAYAMDQGKYYKCFVANVTGGTKNKENKGINIRLECDNL